VCLINIPFHDEKQLFTDYSDFRPDY